MKAEPQRKPLKIRKKDRRIARVIAIILVVIATIGWMRFQQALRHWYYLINLGVWPPPIYQAVSGGMIGITHSLGLIFHLSKRPFTAAYLRIINVLLLIWLWIDRIFFTIRDYFMLLLAGTIFISILLVCFDVLLYRNIIFPQIEVKDAPEN